MDFFDIGPGEILLIMVVALIVFGPERLVGIGRTLGKTMYSFKKAASDLTAQVTKEIDAVKAEVKDAAQLPDKAEAKSTASAPANAPASPAPAREPNER